MDLYTSLLSGRKPKDKTPNFYNKLSSDDISCVLRHFISKNITATVQFINHPLDYYSRLLTVIDREKCYQLAAVMPENGNSYFTSHEGFTISMQDNGITVIFYGDCDNNLTLRHKQQDHSVFVPFPKEIFLHGMRQQGRFDLSNKQTQCFFSTNGKKFTATCLNISKSGIALLIDSQLDISCMKTGYLISSLSIDIAAECSFEAALVITRVNTVKENQGMHLIAGRLMFNEEKQHNILYNYIFGDEERQKKHHSN